MSGFEGGLACLGAAALWAVAVAVFRDPIERHGARAVNFAKCALALAMLSLTAALTGDLAAIGGVPGRDLALVAVSGVVGLTVGDTALFAAVRRIGSYRTLLFQNLTPAFTAAVAFAWLGRTPAPTDLAGAAVTLCGVILVVSARRRDAPRGPIPWAGVALAAAAAAGQGAGIVLAKEGMADLSPLPAAVVRLAAATAGLVPLAVWALWRAPTHRIASAILHRGDGAFRIVVGTGIGTYLAFFLMMQGIATAPETVAAVLLSTTPVFGLAVDRAVGRERITGRAVVGTALAVAGVLVLAAGGSPP